MLWEGGPQLKDFVGWFLDNSSFSKMQHRRFGRVGVVASDGHEHPSLALSLGSFSPKTHEKMAFTVTSSFSRRPIASAGGPLALLYLLRDGKICLEISTCRLGTFTRDLQCTCLQLEDREPYAGLGHADYAMAWDRSMPVCHSSVTNSAPSTYLRMQPILRDGDCQVFSLIQPAPAILLLERNDKPPICTSGVCPTDVVF